MGAGCAVGVEGAYGEFGEVEGGEVCHGGGEPLLAVFVVVEVLGGGVHGVYGVCCLSGLLWRQWWRRWGQVCQSSKRMRWEGSAAFSPLWSLHAMRSEQQQMCAMWRTAWVMFFPAARLRVMCSAGVMLFIF